MNNLSSFLTLYIKELDWVCKRTCTGNVLIVNVLSKFSSHL